MKELSSYIIEKLDINKVNLDKFPIDENIIDMADFLGNYKFEELEDSDDYGIRDIFDVFNECKNKCYMMDITKRKWIRICDTSKGKISKNNPCVFIHYKIKNYDLESPHSDDIHLSREECLKYLKDKFGIK